MKFAKLIGAATILVGSIVASSVVFAADSTVSIGKPVDVTGAEVTEFKSGTVVAVPLDITTPTGTVSNFDLFLGYDNEYVTTKVTEEEADAFEDLGWVDYENDASYITAFYGKKGKTGNYTANGNYVGADENPYDAISWNTTADLDLDAGAEIYFIVKITKDVPDEALNVALFKDSPYNVVGWSASTQSINDLASQDADKAKANATQGAFKVVLKAENLTKYVKSMAVEYNGNTEDITEYVKISDTEYEFPVRVNKTDGSTEDIEVTVYGMCYSDLAASAGEEVIELAKGTISMNGSVTDYAELKN